MRKILSSRDYMGMIINPKLSCHPLHNGFPFRSDDCAIFPYQNEITIEEVTIHIIEDTCRAIIRISTLMFLTL